MMPETTKIEPAARTASHARVIQVGRDFMIGLALFTGLMLATTWWPGRQDASRAQMFSSSAYAAPVLTLAAAAPEELQPSAIYRSTDRSEATVILGIAFASLVAFNLGFLRHLRRVYASPR
jgi:hypothetical protein